MAHDQNGRGITGPGNGMRGPSWRPQDQHDMRDDDDRNQDIRGRRDVRGRDMHGRDDDFGQGQSGYGAGRFGDDRSMMMDSRNRNQSDRWGRGEEHDRGFGTDDRFSGGRGGEDYWLDRSDRPNPQWDRRDRDFERHQRERMGYFGPRPEDRDRHDTGYRGGGLPPQPSSVRHHGYGMEGSHRPSSREDRFDRSGGGHRGKGPMGYTRSDERIREMVCEALTDNDDVDASNIDVVVKNCEVTLSGTVDDRQQKRLAEDIAERCAGVKDVSNQLKVGSPSQTQSSSQNAGNPNGMTGVGKNDKPRA
jgi:hypothetical protein